MNDKIDYGKFDNIMSQFIPDLLETFPEYTPLVNKWWKNENNFNDIEDEEERKEVYIHEHKKCLKFIYKYCTSKLTPHTLLILQKDESLFTDTSIDTEFLPYLHFRNLWALEVSDTTRNKLWNYLRLVLLSIIGCDDSENSNENLQEQINSVLEEFMNMTNDDNSNNGDDDSDNNDNNDNDESEKCGGGSSNDSFQNMMSDLLDSKLGSIAKEFSSDFASSLNLDTSNPDSVKESLGNLMKDPSKLMSMAGNISEKLTDKINNGELDESELMSESSKMLEKLSGLKGTKDINQLFKSMGMGDLMGNLGGGAGGGGKVNVGAMTAKLKQQVATEQMKQRMKAKLNKKMASANESENKVFTEEDERKRQQCENELLEMIDESTDANANKQLAKKNKKKKTKNTK